MAARKCSVPECEGKHYGRGLCKKHYNRKRKTGSLELKTLEQRFHEKYEVCPESGCWLWTASVRNGGYGQLNVDGKIVGAHRVSYELHNGLIPENDSYHGMCVLHKCDTPRCVNPEHLFLGTHQDKHDRQKQERPPAKRLQSRHVKTN